ncbi:MAG: DUF378 domain-containing protein [Patescibacteria group bacterium]|nr:DUF378 domain-containing protein [Patescibacteria group bacterium]
MKALHMIAYTLVIIGALNWGLVGFFNFDLVAKIFGEMSMLSKVIYAVVGIAAIAELVTHKSACKHCAGSSPS